MPRFSALRFRLPADRLMKEDIKMIQFAKTWLRLKQDERAVTALEYALIAGLIAVVIIGAVTTLGSTLSGTFTKVSSSIASA